MKPENRILKLTAKLPNRLHIAKEMEPQVVNCEYEAHHCSQVVISESIAEFQVLRYFDIEIQPCDAEEYAYYNKLTPQEKALVDKIYEENDDAWEFWDEYWNEHDIMECSYKFDTGEYMQKWINLKTGRITIIGKPYKYKRQYCDWNRKKWQIITPRMKFYKPVGGIKL